MIEQQKVKRATYHLWTFGFSKMISTFGNSIYVFGISLYILTLTGSAMSFAINLICTVLPRTVLAPFAGYVADRYSKKAIIITSQSFSLLFVSGLLVYSLTYGLSLEAIYTTTVLLTISSMFTAITFTASITRLIDSARIQKATAINQMSVSVSTIGGPIVGGILFAFASIELFLLLFIVSFAAAVSLEATMNFKLFAKHGSSEDENQKSIRNSMLSGFRYIKTQPMIIVVIATSLCVNFFFAAVIVGMPYLIVEVLQVEAVHFGIIEGVFAGGVLLGALYFSIRKEVKYPLISTKQGLVFLSALMALFSVPVLIGMEYVPVVVYYACLSLLQGIALTYVNTPIGVMMQKTIDERYKGRVFGVVETMAQALLPISILIYGVLYEVVGPVWTLIPTSIALLAVTFYLLRKSVLQRIYPEKVKRNGEDYTLEEANQKAPL